MKTKPDIIINNTLRMVKNRKHKQKMVSQKRSQESRKLV